MRTIIENERTATTKTSGDFSWLLRDRGYEERAEESARIQGIRPYSDEEIEILSQQKPITQPGETANV